jgi:hypothetical protein
MSDFYNGGNGGGGGGTPAITELFEVYIDRNNASNNKNVNYANIVSAINAEKLVYLKILDENSVLITCYLQSVRSDLGRIYFVGVDSSGRYTSRNCIIYDDNTYGYYTFDILSYHATINESTTPPTSSTYFNNMKAAFDEQREREVVLKYIDPNSVVYKLRAVKSTATDMTFSIYDPSTASNLSIIVRNDNSYTVIT